MINANRSIQLKYPQTTLTHHTYTHTRPCNICGNFCGNLVQWDDEILCHVFGLNGTLCKNIQRAKRCAHSLTYETYYLCIHKLPCLFSTFLSSAVSISDFMKFVSLTLFPCTANAQWKIWTNLIPLGIEWMLHTNIEMMQPKRQRQRTTVMHEADETVKRSCISRNELTNMHIWWSACDYFFHNHFYILSIWIKSSVVRFLHAHRTLMRVWLHHNHFYIHITWVQNWFKWEFASVRCQLKHDKLH